MLIRDFKQQIQDSYSVRQVGLEYTTKEVEFTTTTPSTAFIKGVEVTFRYNGDLPRTIVSITSLGLEWTAAPLTREPTEEESPNVLINFDNMTRWLVQDV